MSGPIDDALLLQLDALIDGALSEGDAAQLQSRIDAEPALQAEYERRRRTAELVRALPVESAPQGFADAILAQLPEPTSSSVERPAPPSGRVRSLWMWGTGLAAAAAAVIVIVVSIGGGDPPPSDDWTVAKKETDALKDRSEFKQVSEKPEEALGSKKEKVEGRAELRTLVESEDVDAEAPDMDATTESADAELAEESKRDVAGRQRGGASTRRARAESTRTDATLALLKQVEQPTTVLSAKDRVRYLNAIRRVDEATLRVHFGRVALPSPEPAKAPGKSGAPSLGGPGKKAKGKVAKSADRGADATAADAAKSMPKALKAPEPTFQLTVPSRAEAQSLKAALVRAFPPVVKDKDSGAPAVRSVRSFSADPGVLQVDWTISRRDLATMATLLRRLGLRSAGISARTTTVTRAAEAKREDEPGLAIGGTAVPAADTNLAPVRVSVRILFGPQPRAPERPAGEDK